MYKELDLCATPFTDKMLNKTSLNLTSFHALPINQLKSLKHSRLLTKYLDLLGPTYANSEITYTGDVMDSPVIPNDVLKESLCLTAKAFGAKETLYVTTGTTISNFVAVMGSCKPNDRILVDRNCHQSIHFALKLNKNRVDYSNNIFQCKNSERIIMDVNELLDKYIKAFEEGDPYKLVILNSCSYEGVMYDLKPLLSKLLKINDKVNLFIDEAWFSFGYFHDYYKKYSAMDIANTLTTEHPDYQINIVSTQSAHKSLSALRQGSYIHINGSDEFIKSIWNYKYMLHTTSPNYSILSSLELARSQMILEGKDLIERMLNNSLKLVNAVNKLSEISINKLNKDHWFFIDPTKISVNFSKKDIPINVISKYLLQRGIYVNRKTATSILFNIHIGISEKDIDHLIDVLGEINDRKFQDYCEKTDKSNYYLIAYPPGIPVILPGDKVQNSEHEKIKYLKHSGASLIKIYN